VRTQQTLDREELIGQIAIYAGALVLFVLILALGFAAFRLVTRLIPMPAPRPVVAQSAAQPAAQPRPARQPARTPAQPARQPAMAMPQPIYLAVEATAYRPTPQPEARPNGRGPKGSRPAGGHMNNQPLPAH